jgi:Photoprotection regulator fluorescence recovery protein
MALDPDRLRDLHWSHKEKSIARAAFDDALARENAAIRKEVEAMLQQSNDPTVVWYVHELLSKRHQDLGRKYDYRYSVLIGVFARLLHEGWLAGSDLAGLSPEKLQLIQRGAATVKELDA